ncbi:HD-GYP domain-containing protein [Anaerocolumna xylanovorans]|uniref:HDIG domain-containing protein n=1 Tax=Anaerocolumna xylanovorans DSM 12503 TaxID=1121345 RepID=A0A1M7YDJ3_9FIRM|nr:HD domain-containing phosphohydrolase [Anaerocolumna xylanovorans]SHO50707.1 HDIG domain-containing protein [Anaerocolumna xylanovorans DSM 12503]
MQAVRELTVEDRKELSSILTDDMEEAIDHGILVSRLAYLLAEETGCDESFCYAMADAGLVHDIGKLRLGKYLYASNRNTLIVEEMKYIRMHPDIGYDILKKYGYNEEILKAVLYHHENYDGSGYPNNLKGNQIPLGGRILRICDVYAALISDRRYRCSYHKEAAMQLMIEEVKNFDMKLFLNFLSIAYTEPFTEVDKYAREINKKNFSWKNILHDGTY